MIVFTSVTKYRPNSSLEGCIEELNMGWYFECKIKEKFNKEELKEIQNLKVLAL